jgi:hypothetical protein
MRQGEAAEALSKDAEPLGLEAMTAMNGTIEAVR